MPERGSVGKVTAGCAALAFANAIAGASSTAPTFNGPQFVLGPAPTAIVIADLDGDGIEDVAATTAAEVCVHRGCGDGTFVELGRHLVGTAPSAIVTGDVNGDTNADLVVTNEADGTVSVLRGLGNGDFAPATSFPVGAGPVDLLLIDVDGDSTLDLVTSNGGDGAIAFLLGDGTGSFDSTFTFNLGTRTAKMSAGKIFGIHAGDIAVATPDLDQVRVLRALGGGQYANGGAIDVGDEPVDVGLIDLDDDGDDDLVVANRRDDTVTVVRATAAGPVPLETIAAGNAPVDVHVTEITGDGRADVIVTAEIGDQLTLLAGTNEGILDFPIVFPTGNSARATRTADLDDDGLVDAIVLAGEDTFTVHRGDPAEFLRSNRFIDVDSCTFRFTFEDLDGDGIGDIVGGVLTQSPVDHVGINYGRADGTFEPTRRVIVGNDPAGLVVADLDGDGHRDIVTANRIDDDLTILLADGQGSFAPPVSIPIGESPTDVEAADLDGDTVPDLVVAVSLEKLTLLFGNGDGTFGTPVVLDVSLPNTVELRDFDEDGDPDIVSVSIDQVAILLNDGTGGFATPAFFGTELTTGLSGVAPVIGDVNGDGTLDVVATTDDESSVAVLLGRGNGTLALPLLQATLYLLDYPQLVDLDGDERLDLIALSETGQLVVLRGDARGAFAPAEIYALPSDFVGGIPRLIRAVDFDGDGDQDVLASFCGGNIALLENLVIVSATPDLNGDGHVGFADLGALLVSWGPCADCPADLDGNGSVGFADLQVILANWSSE